MRKTKSGKTIRAFVALEFDATGVRRVMQVAYRQRMASGAPSATWTAAAKVHVTLKFMADLPLEAVGPMGKALDELVASKRAPHAGASSLTALPSIDEGRVVVLALEDPRGDLSKLAAKIDKVASAHGVARETRAFRPHVTIARLKRPFDTRRWLKPDLAAAAGVFDVARLTMYRSDLGADVDGTSVYVPLATFDYRGG